MTHDPEQPTSNPMLAFCIYNAATMPGDSSTINGRIAQGAVHSWYEAHIEGEARAGNAPLPSKDTSGNPFPSPPFPDPSPDNDRFQSILAIAGVYGDGEFVDADPLVRIALACTLAWEAGLKEGAACPGCTHRGSDHDPEQIARIRAGLHPIPIGGRG